MSFFLQASPKKRSAKKAKSDGPKRAKTAFFFFSDANRAPMMEKLNLQSKDIGALAKALGAAWKEMSEEEKKPYNTMAEKDKKRYESEKGK